MTVLIFFLGLAFLVGGAEILVRGASQLGLVIGISPLVVGLTIVAFGTSSPEMAISVQAVLTNHPDILTATIVGSTVFNILFILGICAIISPLKVSQQLVWYEVPIMIGAHLLLFALAFDGSITKFNAFILFISLIVYTIIAIIKGRKESKAVADEYQHAFSNDNHGSKALVIVKQCGLILIGLIFCVIGSNWLLDSVVTLAKTFGISELVIGLTIVAASTSLPEIATSVVATIKGQKDIAVGNVVGSNIFNILGILGVAGLVAPDKISVAPSILSFDLPVAIATCVACLPVFFTGHQISRWEGVMFFGYYAAYTIYLLMLAQEHDALPMMNMVMLWFLIPLTVLTFAIVIYRTTFKKRV